MLSRYSISLLLVALVLLVSAIWGVRKGVLTARISQDIENEIGDLQRAGELYPLVGAIDQVLMSQKSGRGEYMLIDMDGVHLGGSLYDVPHYDSVPLGDQEARHVTARSSSGPLSVYGRWFRIEGAGDVFVARRSSDTNPSLLTLLIPMFLSSGAVTGYFVWRRKHMERKLQKQLETFARNFEEALLRRHASIPFAPDAERQVRQLVTNINKKMQLVSKIRMRQSDTIRSIEHDVLGPLLRALDSLDSLGEVDGRLPAIVRQFELAESNFSALLLVARYDESSPVDLVDIDLFDSVSVFIEDARSNAQAANVHLHLRENDRSEKVTAQSVFEPLRVLCDNILRNAIKYSDEGMSVIIEYGLSEGAGSSAYIRVLDRGPGLAGFDPDFDFEYGPKRIKPGPAGKAAGGNGVGLLSAFAAAKFIGVTMEFENRTDNIGLSVTIRFPAKLVGSV